MTKMFHIFLAVADLNRSIEFYKKAFEGTEVLYEFRIDGLDITMLGLGNGVVLELIQKPRTRIDAKSGETVIEGMTYGDTEILMECYNSVIWFTRGEIL